MKSDRERKMRRVEFQVDEEGDIREFLTEMTFGFLGTGAAANSFPEVTPLNYVYTDDRVYFHGSRVGRKMENLRGNGNVTFVVAKEFAIIPSYFTDPDFACPATAFFKSVTIRGYASEVEDLDEKVRALSALMEKLQPQGGYRPFDLDDAEYRKNVKGVCVVKIDPLEITAKFKFGQNRKGADWEGTRKGLKERSAPMDSETIAMMEKYCPAHRKTAGEP